MIRLFGFYGSLERDIDVIAVADKVDEGYEFLYSTIIPIKKLDAHVYTTEEFTEAISRSIFLMNVYLNGNFLINELRIDVDVEEMKRIARMDFEELCRKGKPTSAIAYSYLISKGIFPKDVREVRRILGIDPKTDNTLVLCNSSRPA